jgi:hypothetical protein
MDEEALQEAIAHAQSLAKLRHETLRTLNGLTFNDKMSVMTTVVLQILKDEFESPAEIMASIASFTAILVNSFTLFAQVAEDMDDDEDEPIMKPSDLKQ